MRAKNLKVPKGEIFDPSDFHDLYTIKSLREGDFGVKIEKIKTNIYGFIWGREIPYASASGTNAQAQNTHQKV